MKELQELEAEGGNEKSSIEILLIGSSSSSVGQDAVMMYGIFKAIV